MCAHVCVLCVMERLVVVYPERSVKGSPSEATMKGPWPRGTRRPSRSLQTESPGLGCPKLPPSDESGVPWGGPARRASETAPCMYLQEACGHGAVVLGQHQAVHKHPEEGLRAAGPGPRVLQDAVELEQEPPCRHHRCVWLCQVQGQGARAGLRALVGGPRKDQAPCAGLGSQCPLPPRAVLSPRQQLGLRAGFTVPRVKAPASPSAPEACRWKGAGRG